MANRSTHNDIWIVPFKTQQDSGKYGQFSNTTRDGEFKVKQTVEFVVGDSKESENFEWKSAERAYHGQKVIDALERIITELSEQQHKNAAFNLGLEMLRKIETGGKTENNEFLPRKNGDPEMGYDGIVREYVPKLMGYSETLRNMVTEERNKEGGTSQNAPVYAFANFAEANGQDRRHREKNLARMKVVCELKQESNPRFRDLVEQCLKEGVMPCETSRHDTFWAAPGNMLSILHLEVALERLRSNTRNFPFADYKITNVRATWNQLRQDVRGVGFPNSTVLEGYQGQHISLNSRGDIKRQGAKIRAADEDEKQDSNSQTNFEAALLSKRVWLIRCRARKQHLPGPRTTVDLFFDTKAQANAIHQMVKQTCSKSSIVPVSQVTGQQTQYLGGGKLLNKWKVSISPNEAKQLFSPEHHASFDKGGAVIDLNHSSSQSVRRRQDSNSQTNFEVALLSERVSLIRCRARKQHLPGPRTTVDLFFGTKVQADAIHRMVKQIFPKSSIVPVSQVTSQQTQYLGGDKVLNKWKVSISPDEAKQLFSPEHHASFDKGGAVIDLNHSSFQRSHSSMFGGPSFPSSPSGQDSSDSSSGYSPSLYSAGC